MIVEHSCRSDGIGRRSGLKIHRWRHRAGSSPASGTILSLDAVRVQALSFARNGALMPRDGYLFL